MATYYYFKSTGKWKYEGKGADIPLAEFNLSHDRLRELNGGRMPGITSDGKSYIVVIVNDNTSFPHLIFNEETET